MNDPVTPALVRMARSLTAHGYSAKIVVDDTDVPYITLGGSRTLVQQPHPQAPNGFDGWLHESVLVGVAMTRAEAFAWITADTSQDGPRPELPVLADPNAPYFDDQVRLIAENLMLAEAAYRLADDES